MYWVGNASRQHATMPGMQDHELYRRILGIEATEYVDSVELKLEAGEIHVHLPRDAGVAVLRMWRGVQTVRP